MPARDDHINQARHNVRFYTTIDKFTFKDWAATVLFYTALHYIDAFLDQIRNIHPITHKSRDKLLATVTELRPIFPAYSALKNASFNARYFPPVIFTDQYVNDLEVRHLARIKVELGRYLQL